MNYEKNRLLQVGKRFFALVLLFVATLNVFIVNGNKAGIEDLNLDKVEVLAKTEDDSFNPYCHNGGPGASECSIETGINIPGGYGVSAKCNVTCRDGYYACCGIRCTCKKE